jgi:lipoate-protein ligase A
MALDEALLEAVAADPSHAAFRTYEWTVPTLSLGYFQKLADALSDPRWRDLPIVRRPTGGGAIWHDHDLTYALILPASHPLARRGGTFYQAVHGAIAEILRAHGIPVRGRGGAPPMTAERRPLLCFNDSDPEDLILGGVKVVGSAQRRRSGAVLQHGSILLARSSQTPELAGISDLVPTSGEPAFWSTRVREALPAALGLCRDRVVDPPALRERTLYLQDSVYRNPSWHHRR